MTLHSEPVITSQEFVHNKIRKVDRYRWKLKDKEKPGVCMEIPKNELSVDPVYQRDGSQVSEGKILRIAGNWSWMACGVLLVAERDGSFFVMDGQHRWKAALRREDIKELPCLVFETISVEEEARAFLSANTERKPVTGWDKYKALVAIKDPAALLLKELSLSYRREVTDGKGRVGTISCVSCLIKHARISPSVLRRIWPVLMDLTESCSLPKTLVEGLMYIETHMLDDQSLTEKKWRSRLMRVESSGLIEGAEKAGAFYRRNNPRTAAIGMIEAINYKSRVRLVIKGEEASGELPR